METRRLLNSCSRKGPILTLQGAQRMVLHCSKPQQKVMTKLFNCCLKQVRKSTRRVARCGVIHCKAQQGVEALKYLNGYLQQVSILMQRVGGQVPRYRKLQSMAVTNLSNVSLNLESTSTCMVMENMTQVPR